MEQLSYQALREAGYKGYLLEDAPEKVMQFGEGNFLRAFADYWFDVSNEKAGWNGKCVLVQPIAQGLSEPINRQQGLYTLYLRGREHGEKVERKRVISCVSRCLNPYEAEGFAAMMELAVSDDLEYVVSNTTEAGIVYDPACRLADTPAASFPGKLSQVLYQRWRAGRPGLVILSCELIDNNGRELLGCVNRYVEQWGLEDGFREYVNGDCTFCSTLVDRIVPGRVRDPEEVRRVEAENGYRDELMDVGEVFGVWNIEGPEWLADKLPFRRAGLNCPVVPDVTPYKKRKVRILNGAHTGMVLGAWLAGFNIVRDCMQDETVRGFMNKMLYDEVIPVLPLARQDLEDFAAAVQDRFNNPFVDHELLSISLNSTSKWRARNLPSLLEYTSGRGAPPPCLTMGFAAYLAFYSSRVQDLSDEGLVCRRENGDAYVCKDDRWILEFYWEHRNDNVSALVHAVMTDQRMWGRDLTEVPGLEEAVVGDLSMLRERGALEAYRSCLEGGAPMPDFIRIHPADNVAVALRPVPKGSQFEGITAAEEILQGHKMALEAIRAGDNVIKYGFPIGHATAGIAPGDWVHTHNLATNLAGEAAYRYQPRFQELPPSPARTFRGYRRRDGGVGIRNELWIIPTVGCVNDVAKALVRENQDLVDGSIDGLYAFPHPFGCSQTGADHAQTRRLLAALARHPNAGAVLVVGLGCENLTHEQFVAELGSFDPDRVKFLTCQEVPDEMVAGRELLEQCAAYARRFQREDTPAAELVVGMKCGGSDGLSGITANPVVGRFSDRLIAQGGSTVLTEVPEMFGAEGLLLDRCVNEAVFQKAVDMINGFKNYFIRHGEAVYDNPSPGNKQGGITTLEDKSCGCVQKGGTAPVMDVLGYGEAVTTRGLNLLYGPGNDLVSATALTAAGAHLILFTTGRGTPFGALAPTLKIASNTPLAVRKAGWVDFNAGAAVEGVSLDEIAYALMELVLETASGKPTCVERKGFREISIFKDGVVL